jgi:hypothetical protein
MFRCCVCGVVCVCVWQVPLANGTMGTFCRRLGAPEKSVVAAMEGLGFDRAAVVSGIAVALGTQSAGKPLSRDDLEAAVMEHLLAEQERKATGAGTAPVAPQRGTAVPTVPLGDDVFVCSARQYALLRSVCADRFLDRDIDASLLALLEHDDVIGVANLVRTTPAHVAELVPSILPAAWRAQKEVDWVVQGVFGMSLATPSLAIPLLVMGGHTDMLRDCGPVFLR